MAIGWLTILQSVPWTEVIKNAPKVAEGARKLWSAVAKKHTSADDPASSTQPAVSAEPHTLAALETRTTALEAAISDLHGQMLASSELIKAQLIKRIEANRKRTLWLGAATLVLAIVVLTAVPF